MKAIAIVDRYTTDTLLINDRQLTDTLATHYQCYCGWLSTDLMADTRPKVNITWSIYRPIVGDANCRLIHHWYLTDTRPTIHRYIADKLPMLSWLTVGWSVDRQENTTWPKCQSILSKYSTGISVESLPSVGQHSSQYINQQSPKRYMILHVVIYTRFQKRYIVMSPNSKIFQYWAHTSTSEPCS